MIRKAPRTFSGVWRYINAFYFIFYFYFILVINSDDHHYYILYFARGKNVITIETLGIDIYICASLLGFCCVITWSQPLPLTHIHVPCFSGKQLPFLYSPGFLSHYNVEL